MKIRNRIKELRYVRAGELQVRGDKPWSDTPVSFIPLPPGCPYCGHRRRIAVRSIHQGDGSREQRFVCKRCSERYRVVVDPALPITGNGELDSSYD